MKTQEELIRRQLETLTNPATPFSRLSNEILFAAVMIFDAGVLLADLTGGEVSIKLPCNIVFQPFSTKKVVATPLGSLVYTEWVPPRTSDLEKTYLIETRRGNWRRQEPVTQVGFLLDLRHHDGNCHRFRIKYNLSDHKTHYGC